jgi:crossover junction endodeoxyribonuclease RuvC
MLSWIVGIDPGVQGAFAFLGSDGSIELIDIPNVSAAGKKVEIDEDQVCRLFDNRSSKINSGWIEHTWARPGEGVVNAATQVGHYQFLRGVLRANFIPLQKVAPQRWRREMKLGKGKDASRVRCSEMLPTHSAMWPLKKHNGRCDALLIGLYGARQTSGFIEPFQHGASKIGAAA